MKYKFPEQFTIAPHSWILPKQYAEFEQIRKLTQDQGKFFILKPVNSSCGRGIKVVQGNQKIANREDVIVSTYIDKPLLINGKKFDMRMYVLVTSFHPLRIYLYNEGLARFATE